MKRLERAFVWFVFVWAVSLTGYLMVEPRGISEDRLVASMIDHKRNSCDPVRDDLALGQSVSRHCHFEYVYRAHELRALVNGE